MCCIHGEECEELETEDGWGLRSTGVDVDEVGIVVVGGDVDAAVAVAGDSEPSCRSVRTLFWCHAIWTRIGGGMLCW